jgi:PST family polysaccharide transporter
MISIPTMRDPTDDIVATETADSRHQSEVQRRVLSVPPAAEFKRRSVRGGTAAVLGQAFSIALQIGTTVVLARLLSPADYGLQAMVITLTGFFSLFKDAGLSVATVQRETLTHEQISTLFWINLGLGTFLTIAVAATGPFLVAFYKEPRLLWLTIASSSIFLFNSLSVQHKALLDRSMRFGTGVKIDILTATIGSVVAVGMAALGCGYWSLICQNITLPIVGTAATWIAMPWLPGRPRWTTELRSMARFGGTVTLNSFVVYVAYNTEKILLGRFWGAAPLGIYSRAYQLANLPVQQLISSVHGVAFSALSRIQGEAQRLQRAYLKSQTIIVSLTIPVIIACAFFAREIVLAMLGQKWIAAAPVLRFLAPTILIFALVNPFSWLLQATGRVQRSLNIAFLICPVVILGILAGLRHGPSGVALGYSAAMLLLFVPIVAWATHGTGITAASYWDSVKRPLIAGMIGGGMAWLLSFLFGAALAPIPLLAVELTTSFVVYVVCLFLVMGQKEFYVDLVRNVMGRRQGATA